MVNTKAHKKYLCKNDMYYRSRNKFSFEINVIQWTKTISVSVTSRNLINDLELLRKCEYNTNIKNISHVLLIIMSVINV